MGTSGERETAREATDAAVRVREVLERQADEQGFLPFDRFMEIALYAPGVGYYDRPDSPLGFAGDFYTAPQLHPIFGATLGRHVADVVRTLGNGTPLRIVELGPGDGELAATVITEVARDGPSAATLEYVLVERATRRGDAALRRARDAAQGTVLRPRRGSGLGAEGPFSGVVIAHEFWDAQPVRRLRRHGNDWEELGVRFASGQWDEAARPLPRYARPTGLPSHAEDGSVVEVAPEAEAILRAVGDHLVRGRAIFVDYGDDGDEILRTHRFGTLTAVRGHRVLETILEQPGEVDLSAYVNFTRIREAAARAGLDIAEDRSQAEALVAWGLEEVKARWDAASDPHEALRVHLAVKNLLFGFPRFRALEFVPQRVVAR